MFIEGGSYKLDLNESREEIAQDEGWSGAFDVRQELAPLPIDAPEDAVGPVWPERAYTDETRESNRAGVARIALYGADQGVVTEKFQEECQVVKPLDAEAFKALKEQLARAAFIRVRGYAPEDAPQMTDAA